MMNSISAYLSDTLQKLRPHSIDAILQTVHPESEEKLKKMLSKGLLNILSRDETIQYHQFRLIQQIENFLSRPIGKLSEHISEEKVRRSRKISDRNDYFRRQGKIARSDQRI